MGLYFEQYHRSRIGGRLLGLLLLSEHPLGLGEMADLLGVSRASVSANIRTTADFGLTELVSLPGDRRDYYQVGPHAWTKGLEARIEGTRQLRRIAEQGLLDFCDFAIAEQIALVERWRARRAEHPPNGG